jgi:hypothetical protein
VASDWGQFISLSLGTGKESLFRGRLGFWGIEPCGEGAVIDFSGS